MLSVILPVYNLAESIEANSKLVYDNLVNLKVPFEFIISDDTSTDGTTQLCKNMQKKFENFRLLTFTNGPSRRENLSKAIKEAKGDIIIFLDADLSVSPELIPRLIDEINGGMDIVTGSRYVKDSLTNRGIYRGIISKLYNIFMNVYFGSKIRDHQCGFKGFRQHVVLRLIEDLGYDSEFRRGWFWDAELLIRAQRKKYAISEIPITWHPGKRSTFSFRREIKMVPYVLGLRRRL